MYKDVLTKILALNDTLPDIYADVYYGDEVRSTKRDKLSMLFIFATNTILVLEGKRLTYRISIPNIDMVISLVHSVCNITVGEIVPLSIIPSEPLLVLKSNYDRVTQHFVEALKKPDENSIHIAFGEVLGYAYTGEDWASDNSDSLNVSYNISIKTIVGSFDGEHSLYCFNVPMSKYTGVIQLKIFEDLDKYTDILEKYDITVSLSVWLWAEGSINLLDTLPEPPVRKPTLVYEDGISV